MLFMIIALIIYAFVAVYVAIEFLPEHWLAELVYYTIIGIAWAFPAKKLMVWMHAPDAYKDEV